MWNNSGVLIVGISVSWVSKKNVILLLVISGREGVCLVCSLETWATMVCIVGYLIAGVDQCLVRIWRAEDKWVWCFQNSLYKGTVQWRTSPRVDKTSLVWGRLLRDPLPPPSPPCPTLPTLQTVPDGPSPPRLLHNAARWPSLSLITLPWQLSSLNTQ